MAEKSEDEDVSLASKALNGVENAAAAAAGAATVHAFVSLEVIEWAGTLVLTAMAVGFLVKLIKDEYTIYDRRW